MPSDISKCHPSLLWCDVQQSPSSSFYFPTWIHLYRVLILSFPYITVLAYLWVHQLLPAACSPHSASTFSCFHDTQPYATRCHFLCCVSSMSTCGFLTIAIITILMMRTMMVVMREFLFSEFGAYNLQIVFFFTIATMLLLLYFYYC